MCKVQSTKDGDQSIGHASLEGNVSCSYIMQHLCSSICSSIDHHVIEFSALAWHTHCPMLWGSIAFMHAEKGANLKPKSTPARL